MNRNYKKVIMVILMVSLVFTLSGCGGKNSPEAIVDSLFSSVKGLFDLIDTDAMDEIDFDKVEGFEEAKTNLKEILSDLNYKVTDVRKTDGVATLEVEIEYVDGEELVADSIGDAFGEIIEQTFSGGEEPTEEELMGMLTKIFNKNYDKFEKVLKKDTVDIHLTKNEDGEWLISELKEDLLNVLTFNSIEDLESLFSGMLDGFLN